MKYIGVGILLLGIVVCCLILNINKPKPVCHKCMDFTSECNHF